MVSTGSPMTPYAPDQTSDEDWPAQIADSIEAVVGTVRDRTTGPLLTVARAIVYGTFVAIVGTIALVLLVIGLVRFVDNYLPDDVFGEDHMWATYLVTGLVFSFAGALLWRQRRVREQSTAG